MTAFVNHRLFEDLGPEPEEAALHAALAAGMAEITGDDRALTPSHVAVFRWRDAAYVGGGPNTSFQPGVLTEVAAVFNRPEGPAGRLIFASTEYATVGTGYVEGAIAAGEFAAAQVAYSAIAAGEIAAGQQPPAQPVLPGRGPRRLRSALFFLAWALLAPAAGLAGLVSGLLDTSDGRGQAPPLQPDFKTPQP